MFGFLSISWQREMGDFEEDKNSSMRSGFVVVEVLCSVSLCLKIHCTILQKVGCVFFFKKKNGSFVGGGVSQNDLMR